MSGFDMNIRLPERRAEVDVTNFYAQMLGIEKGITPCTVLGLFQCIEDTNCAYPVFVCELDDGHVIEASVNRVRFVDGGAV